MPRLIDCGLPPSGKAITPFPLAKNPAHHLDSSSLTESGGTRVKMRRDGMMIAAMNYSAGETVNGVTSSCQPALTDWPVPLLCK